MRLLISGYALGTKYKLPESKRNECNDSLIKLEIAIVCIEHSCATPRVLSCMKVHFIFPSKGKCVTKYHFNWI